MGPAERLIAFGRGEVHRDAGGSKPPLEVALDRAIVTVHRLSPVFAALGFDEPRLPAPTRRPLAMLRRYAGEERAGVRYFSPLEALQYRVIVRDGRLFEADGRTPVDSSRARSRHSGSGAATMALDLEGNLYLCGEEHVGGEKVHHSSFTRGAPLAFSGEAVVEDGHLVAVTDKSGHYRPSFAHAVRFFGWAQARGLEISRLLVLMVEGRGIPE